MKGIDIYHGEGDIDFRKVKADGIEFVIVKMGGSEKASGRWTDPRFYENILKAKDAGLHVGAYFYAGEWSCNYQEGKRDAEYAIKVLQGVKLDFPVFYDFEEPSAAGWKGNTEACKGFCETMEAAGYYVGIYASDISGFKERLDMEQLYPYDFWVARYGKFPQYVPESRVCIWQQTSDGTVDGVDGRVDIDECYIDYPSIIIPKHFNNY